MVLFEKTGKENTLKTAQIAVAKAKELGCDLVLSSYTGESARVVLKEAKAVGFEKKVIVVRGTTTADRKGVFYMDEQTYQELEKEGAVIVTSAHALSAGERGISKKHQGAYPLEIMADTLRTFGAGTKVCFECSVMALDCGALPYGETIVAMGGTAEGLDTALVITPSYSSSILDTVVHEILCKPALYDRVKQ